jgi:hypothetical protein
MSLFGLGLGVAIICLGAAASNPYLIVVGGIVIGLTWSYK